MIVLPFLAVAAASQWLAFACVSGVFGRTRRTRHDRECARDRDRNQRLQRERQQYDTSNERETPATGVDSFSPSQRRKIAGQRDRPHPRDAGYVELRDRANHTLIAPRDDLVQGSGGLMLTSERWVAARAAVDLNEVR